MVEWWQDFVKDRVGVEVRFGVLLRHQVRRTCQVHRTGAGR